MMLLNTNEKTNANESVCNMYMSKCLYGACMQASLHCTILLMYAYVRILTCVYCV